MAGNLAASRGWTTSSLIVWLAGWLCAWLSTLLAVQLRTPSDGQLAAQVLDSGVIVGLALPAYLVSILLLDQVPWLSLTAQRHQATWRFVLFLCVTLMSTLSASLMTPLMAAVATPLHLFVVYLLLYSASVISAVVFGSSLGWVLGSSLAIVCSVPGVVPLKYNLLAVVGPSHALLFATGAALLLAAGVYIRFDHYGLSVRARVFERGNEPDG